MTSGLNKKVELNQIYPLRDLILTTADPKSPKTPLILGF